MALLEEQNENKEKRGKGTIYSGKHSNKNLLKELLAWMNHIQRNAETQSGMVNSFFGKLSQEPIIHEQQAKDLIYKTWSDPDPVSDFVPEELKDKLTKKNDAQAEVQEKIRNGVYDIYTGSEGIAIDETYYGLFNACTQFFNYGFPAKKDTSFSIVWGNRSNEMNKFDLMNILLDYDIHYPMSTPIEVLKDRLKKEGI